MTSHGQNPSRRPDDKAVHVKISDGDSSHPGSHGGDRSRGPGGPPGSGPTSSGSSDENWFPASARYKRLSDPIAGGMGVVYKALDVNLDIHVAIKRIRPELANDTELIKRFEREAKMQGKLKHQHLVSVKTFDSDTYGPYIVMDWIDGQSLASVIRTGGAMAWRDAAILISKVAMALQEAHENKIIHRDVKPGNILLDKKGEPYITDFGLACAESASVVAYVSEKKATVGTAYFMSPEQRLNPKDVTYLTDVWSLGATLYQLLTKYDVLAMDHRLIPEPLRNIVIRALERIPSDRFGTMKLFAQELIQCVSNNGSKPATAKAAPPPAEEDIADIWRKAQERTDKAHADAKSIAVRKQDYAEAVRIMETIPEHVRKKKLYDELVRRRDRVVALDTKIRESVAQMRSEGLPEAINELLKLQPNRLDMKKLLEQCRPPLLVAPFDDRQARMAQQEWAKYLGVDVEVTNGIGMKFRVIPPGTFDMGSPKSEPQRLDREILHKVTITQPKLLGVYPVTQGEWTKVMGSNPSYFKSDRCGQEANRFPMDAVSWDDCQEFLERMNESHAMKGWQYRLPTEAEWEYACRAGTVTPFWFGGELNGKQANCNGNYPYQTGKGPYFESPRVVGSFGANPFGLYDQHGQVLEWCEDWYGGYDDNASSQADPTGSSSGSSRVLRGGSWSSRAVYCRSAYRDDDAPSKCCGSIGFRLLCELG